MPYEHTSGPYAAVVSEISCQPCHMVCRHLTVAERKQLERWVRARTSPQRLVTRSRIILLAAQGLNASQIARALSVSPSTVRHWCRRFHERGVGTLEYDAPGRGRPRGMSSQHVAAVLRGLIRRSPSGRPWTARSLAEHAGCSATTVWRVWKRLGLTPQSSSSEIEQALRRTVRRRVN
jgi:transposase